MSILSYSFKFTHVKGKDMRNKMCKKHAYLLYTMKGFFVCFVR